MSRWRRDRSDLGAQGRQAADVGGAGLLHGAEGGGLLAVGVGGGAHGQHLGEPVGGDALEQLLLLPNIISAWP